jgi:hypothetical protein
MSMEYTLENGFYTLVRDGERIVHSAKVAVVIDLETGSVVKHGTPDRVEARFNEMRAAFLARGFTQEANDLVYVAGKFDLEELNKMVGICGYAGRFYREKIAVGQTAQATV